MGAPVSPAEWERRLLAMHGTTETEEFLKAVFSLLEGTVVCDFVLANLRNVDSVPLLARDSLGREFGPEYMERFFKANPSVGYVMRRPGLRLLHTRDHLPPEEKLRSLPFYTEFMEPENWRHSVALLFWGFFPPVPQNAFCVFRSEDQADFDSDDLKRLRLVHPHIATALKRLKKEIKSRTAGDRISALLDSLPGNATLLEWDLRITHQSRSARLLSAQWEGRSNESLDRGMELPGEVIRACESLKSEWQVGSNGTSPLFKKRTLPHPMQQGFQAEITLVLKQDSLLAHPTFLVELVESGSPAFANLPQLNVLTPSEREAALLAGDGLSNEEAAKQLGISVAAMKFRLNGAFKKLGVRSRSQLAAMLR